MELLDKWTEKLKENINKRLGPGEVSQKVVLSHVGDERNVLVFAVTATDHNIYIFAIKPVGLTKLLDAKPIKHRIGSVEVRREGDNLIVGDYLLPLLLGTDEADELIAFLSDKESILALSSNPATAHP